MAFPHPLLDPELAAILQLLPPYHAVDGSRLGELRATVEAAARLQVETADSSDVAVGEAFAEDDEGRQIRIALYRPTAADAPLPAYLHLHGGGTVMGRPEMRHANLLAVCRDLGCLIASVDYRLAPEAPFPAALEDAYAAALWLRANATGLGVDGRRIAIGGESAGGGLAAALALLSRDRGDPPFVAQMLSYPMLDDRSATKEPPAHVGEFVWGIAASRFAWSAYLGGPPGAEAISPYAAPARSASFAGLPPTFIGVGALDLFLDEDLDYARRLACEGTAVELHVYPGAFHAFDAAAEARVTQAFKADWRRALARAFSAD